MRDFLSYVRHTSRITLQNDLWFLVIPSAIMLIVVAWTLNVQESGRMASSVAIGEAEALGSLLAVFLCAGLLDPEMRRGASEITFSKPHRPWVLLAVRFGLAILLVNLLLAGMLATFALKYGGVPVGMALLLALPSVLFIGMVSLTVSGMARSPLAGIAVSFGFYLWDLTGGLAYNPLLVLPGGAAAAAGGEAQMGINLPLNKGTLLLCAALLFLYNVRRLVRSGWDSSGARDARPGRRWIGAARVAAIVAAYFWTGALIKLWTLETLPSPFNEMDLNSSMRSTPWQPAVAANSLFRMTMDVYGPAPVGDLLGPGVAEFLRGLGNGLDTNAPEFQSERRAALERAARTKTRWAPRAQLELAAMDATPAPASFGMNAPPPPASEPYWITVGMVDPDRWWIARRPHGANPERADRLCRDLLNRPVAEQVAAEALMLQARIAGERWDFASETQYLTEIAEEYPDLPLAASVIGRLTGPPLSPARLHGAIALGWHVLKHQKPDQQGYLARQISGLMVQAGDQPAARDLLQQTLDTVRRSRSSWRDASQSDASETDLKDALRRLDSPKPANPTDPRLGPPGRNDPFMRSAFPSGAPMPPSSGPGFPVQGQVTLNGRPLSRVACALVPASLAGSAVPSVAAGSWVDPRPAGSPPPTRSPSDNQGFRDYGQSTPDAWHPDGIESYLREHPEAVAHPDSHGRLDWSGVPMGQYAVLLRLDSRALKGLGALAPVPMPGPVTVAGGPATFAPVRLATAMRLSPGRAASGAPDVRWSPVAGAARYRAAVRIDSGAQQGSMVLGGAGAGAPAIDPEVVWWRDGLKTAHTVMDPDHFIGPASDARYSGLSSGIQYTWCIEAFDAAGRLLAISDTLQPDPTFSAPEWIALKLPNAPKGKRPAHVQDAGLTNWGQPGFDPGVGSFDSPFAESILVVDRIPAPRRIIRDRQPVSVPSIVAEGQGLPPRSPIPPPMGLPGSAGGPGMPPGVMATRPGSMAMPPGMNSLPPGMGGMPPGMGRMPPGMVVQLPGHPPMGAMPPGRSPGGPMPPGAAMDPPGRPGGNHRPPGIRTMPPMGGPPGAPMPAGSMGGPSTGRAPMSGMGGRPPSGARPPMPRPSSPGPRPGPAAPAAGASLRPIPLETFDAGSLDRWTFARGAPPADAARNGLPIGDGLSIAPREGAFALPSGARSLTVTTSGGAASGSVELRSAMKTIRAPLKPAGGPADRLNMKVPPGSWSLVSLQLAARPGAEAVLHSIEADVAEAGGIFAVARASGGVVALEIFNLGPAPEHVALFGKGADANAADLEIDLAPLGHALIPVPAGTLGPAAVARWSGGLASVQAR